MRRRVGDHAVGRAEVCVCMYECVQCVYKGGRYGGGTVSL